MQFYHSLLKMVMTNKNSIVEPTALAEKEWEFYEKCRCKNITKYKYRNKNFPDLELEWWIKLYRFRITYRGTKTKVKPTKITLLDTVLKDLINEKNIQKNI